MFETEKEMLESAEIFNWFDFNITKKIAEDIGSKRIIFTGMGSSVLFPAKHAKARASELNVKNHIEVYFASDLFSCRNFTDTYVILCSNSGMTKETILLQDYAKRKGAKTIAVTSVPDSILAKRCKGKIIMQCGFEKGVAATKSVVEQGLILDSLIFNLAKNQGRKVNLNKINKALCSASKDILWNLNMKTPNNMLSSLADASVLYFVGKVTGVADEITLKAHEIARKNAIFYPDTTIFHGVEESIRPSPIVIFEPSKFNRFMDDFKGFSKRTKCKIFEVDSKKIRGGVKVKSTPYFENYCLLAYGFALLRDIAKKLNLNIDKPKKIFKVGNPYI